MDWIISSFNVIFFFLMIATVISAVGFIFIENYRTKGAKIYKKIAFSIIVFFLLLILVGNTFLKTSIKYRIALTDITTSTLIDQTGKSNKIYNWHGYILPATIENYVKYDSITMIKKRDPFDDKTPISLSFVIEENTYLKPKPVAVDTTAKTQTNIKIK